MIIFALAAALAQTALVDPATTVRAMFAAFNRHDAAAMKALYAEDARLTSPDFCAPRGKRDIPRTYAAFFAAYPDIEDRIEDIVIDDDRVAVRFTAVSPSKNFRLPIAAFMRVRDGKIVTDDSYFDVGGRPCEK